MFKIIIIILMVYGILRLWRKMSAPMLQKNEKQKSIAGGEMVPCSNCGTFVIANEVIQRGGKIFCSEKCAG